MGCLDGDKGHNQVISAASDSVLCTSSKPPETDASIRVRQTHPQHWNKRPIGHASGRGMGGFKLRLMHARTSTIVDQVDPLLTT